MSADKPPYNVPLMTEIGSLPWNGYTVASTFSGCGGSCLGYKMAGFRVVWANEFVPSAQDSYRANHKGTVLDGRDICEVMPEDIFKATGLKAGELDLFDGSPPCQAFSTAGKREKGWGRKKSYEHGASQCNETLFTQYTRLLRGLQPRVFIAENVSGLLKGTAKGYFKEILTALKGCGYRVECRLLDAQWLGVPQMRQRAIFIGIRNDLELTPVFPRPLPYRYSVRDALPWVGKAIHDTGGGQSEKRWAANVDITDRPSPTVTIGINSINSHHYLMQDKPEIVHQGGFQDGMRHSCDEPAPTVMAGGMAGGNTTQVRLEEPVLLPPSRQKDGAVNLRVVHPEEPCGTVTCASPGNDLAVPVPGQRLRRRFTIAELKRICSFPDDFILTGSYAQQWERLGNSVPPVMMFHVASALRDNVFSRMPSH